MALHLLLKKITVTPQLPFFALTRHRDHVPRGSESSEIGTGHLEGTVVAPTKADNGVSDEHGTTLANSGDSGAKTAVDKQQSPKSTSNRGPAPLRPVKDRLVDEQRQGQPCSLMVVEVDGTMSPQITEQVSMPEAAPGALADR